MIHTDYAVQGIKPNAPCMPSSTNKAILGPPLIYLWLFPPLVPFPYTAMLPAPARLFLQRQPFYGLFHTEILTACV